MSTLERVAPILEKLAEKHTAGNDRIPCLELEAREVAEAAARLRNEAGFETCTFVTAVDRFPAEPRFEVLWQLHSLAAGDRIRLRARVPSSRPRVPTIVHLYPGAAYFERECYDLFGVVFEGHPGLKRLLMPEEYGYFPLRKDFPHQGIEPDRLYREWDRRRRAGGPEGATT